MTSATTSPARGNALAFARDALTHVELTHIDKRVEHWIRFGHEAQEQILDRRRRIFSFRPGSVFAFVRWAANDFGTIASRIDILRAVAPGEPCQTVPFVRPGAEILLRVAGWPKVQQVLRHIDAVEEAGIDACTVSPDHWRHVGNRLNAGEPPRVYAVSVAPSPWMVCGSARRRSAIGAGVCYRSGRGVTASHRIRFSS